MSRILVISFSDLSQDPRVDRQLEFLRTTHEVIAAGLGPPVDADIEFIDLCLPPRPVLKEAMRQSSSLARLIAHRYQAVFWQHPLNRQALERLDGIGADLVIANDLSSLPLACRVARDAPVVFDAHELATEEHAHRVWWRWIMAPYVRALLSTYLPRTAAVMTVAPGIARLYADEFGIDPVVVTNAPTSANLWPTPVGSPVRLIHHGVALPERRLELTIAAVERADVPLELDLMLTRGNPAYFRRVERLVASSARVRLVDPVQQREIVRRCNEYDVGVFLLPPGNKNQVHVLPNKLFEFIQARLAVVVGPSPEMANIVRLHDCGVVSNGFTSGALVESLEALSPARIAYYKQNADIAAGVLSAENNREVVLRLIGDVLAA